MASSLLQFISHSVLLGSLTAPNGCVTNMSGVDRLGSSLTGSTTQNTEGGSLKLWYVDITSKGTQCLKDPNYFELWRANAATAKRVHLSGPTNFPSATIDFASGQSVVNVDSATFPVGDGLAVTISDATSGATLGEFTLAIITPEPGTSQELASALKERGCLAQLQIVKRAKTPKTS